MPMTLDQVAEVYWSTMDKCLTEQGVAGEIELGGIFGEFKYVVGSAGNGIMAAPSATEARVRSVPMRRKPRSPRV